MKNIYLTVSDPQERKKLKALDGIGRSATRTGIIGNLFSKNILAKQGKKFTLPQQQEFLFNQFQNN